MRLQEKERKSGRGSPGKAGHRPCDSASHGSRPPWQALAKPNCQPRGLKSPILFIAWVLVGFPMQIPKELVIWLVLPWAIQQQLQPFPSTYILEHILPSKQYPANCPLPNSCHHPPTPPTTVPMYAAPRMPAYSCVPPQWSPHRHLQMELCSHIMEGPQLVPQASCLQPGLSSLCARMYA